MKYLFKGGYFDNTHQFTDGSTIWNIVIPKEKPTPISNNGADVVRDVRDANVDFQTYELVDGVYHYRRG